MKHDIWFPSHCIAIYDMMDLMEWLPRNNQCVAPIDLDPQSELESFFYPLVICYSLLLKMAIYSDFSHEKW